MPERRRLNQQLDRRRGQASAARGGVLFFFASLLLLLLSVAARGAAAFSVVATATQTNTYSWALTKTVTGGGDVVSVRRGDSASIAYKVAATRTLDSTKVLLDATVTCSNIGNFDTATLSGVDLLVSGAVVASQSYSGGAVANGGTFSAVSFKAVSLPTAVTAIDVRCNLILQATGQPAPATESHPVTIGTTTDVFGTALVKDKVSWPTWSSYFSGNWLTQTPTVAVTSGDSPGEGGTTVSDSRTWEYTWSISNLVLCFSNVQVPNTATLEAGTAGSSTGGALTRSASAAFKLSVTDCDVVPTFTVDSPVLTTTLSFAWQHSVSPVSSSAVTVPWGGGASVQAKAAFSRTVTSAVFQASFNLAITNPVNAPIMLQNLQLQCGWGGTTYLPCGSSGIAGVSSGTGTALVIPASGTVTCAVTNLPMQGTWGSDFTQPCTIVSSNWLGTNVQYTGLVLNMAAPQRFIKINDCVSWGVTCSGPTGNAFYSPSVGGLPSGTQVCGTDNNAPIPDRTFGVSLSGGWIGDGRQPGACASPVSTTCNSQIIMQSTQGTTQTSGGMQASSLTISATPTDCPAPLPSPAPAPTPPPAGLFASDLEPDVSARVIKTYVSGAFEWDVTSSVDPATQAVAVGSAAVARYTIIADRKPADAATPPAYLIEGEVSATNPATAPRALSVQAVEVVVAGAAVPAKCAVSLPASLNPGDTIRCGYMVNYNRGPQADNLVGRVTTASSSGTKASKDSAAAPFSFSAADTAAAVGACAKVWMAFASDWVELARTGGTSPSLDAASPDDVCFPASWQFDVSLAPKDNAPCGPQQVVNTVTLSYATTTAVTRQGASTATVFVTSPACPDVVVPPAAAAADGGEDATAAPDAEATVEPVPDDATAAAETLSGSDAGAPDMETSFSSVDEANAAAAGGLRVELVDVTSAAGAASTWSLLVRARVAEVRKASARPADVPFVVTWSRKTDKVTSYAGTVSITNTQAAPAVLDSIVVDLTDPNAEDQPTVAQANARCRLGADGTSGEVTPSRTLSVPAGAAVECAFELRARVAGVLTATVTQAESGVAVASSPRPVQRFAATPDDNGGDCARLVTGVAASGIAPDGRLLASGHTDVDAVDVCEPSGSKNVVFRLGRTAGRGCSYPVTAVARLEPRAAASAGQEPVSAAGTATLIITDCDSKQKGAAAVASLANLVPYKVRSMRWSVEHATQPALPTAAAASKNNKAPAPFRGASISVSVVFKRQAVAGQTLSLTGRVLARNAAKAAKAGVVFVPLCAGCAPKKADGLVCKPGSGTGAAAECAFGLEGLPLASGLLLPRVDGGRPAAAVLIVPNGAKRLIANRCAVLADAAALMPPAATRAPAGRLTMLPVDDGSTSKTKAAALPPLPKTPVCETTTYSYTARFNGLACGWPYRFTSDASATPTTDKGGSAAAPIKNKLTFEVVGC